MFHRISIWIDGAFPLHCRLSVNVNMYRNADNLRSACETVCECNCFSRLRLFTTNAFFTVLLLTLFFSFHFLLRSFSKYIT
ncbi:hypothetical protein FKM82_012815 [Ascaphus truei]